VAVSACNINGLCSEKSASIKIPWYAPVPPAATLSTSIVEATQQSKPETQRPEVTKVPSGVHANDPDTETLIETQVTYDASASVLAIIVLITLLGVISTAALADKRPIAIRAIAKTISSQKHKGE